MDRQAILSEIRQLEAVKAREPHMTLIIDEQITQLCDKLKRQSGHVQRKVV